MKMKQGLFVLLLLITATVTAQQKTEKEYKNTIKYNITNPFIFGKNVMPPSREI